MCVCVCVGERERELIEKEEETDLCFYASDASMEHLFYFGCVK